MFGDYNFIKKWSKSTGKTFYAYASEILNKFPEKKFLYMIMGSRQVLHVIDSSVRDEMINLIPDAIDRTSPNERYDFLKLGRHAFGANGMDNFKYKERRLALMRLSGVHRSLKYIKIFFEVANFMGNEHLKEGEVIDIKLHNKRTAFRIISTIIFGKEALKNVPKIKYVNRNGEIEYKDLFEFFVICAMDCTFAMTNIWNVIFSIQWGTKLNLG